MLINSCISPSEIIQVDIKSIERTILNMQKNIYRAVKIYDRQEKYKWQKKILLTKEIVLSVLYNVIEIIKKKFIYLMCTIKNF